jgi:hypothetical protein
MILCDKILVLFLIILFGFYILGLIKHKTLSIDFGVYWIITCIFLAFVGLINKFILLWIPMPSENMLVCIFAVLLLSLVFLVLRLCITISKMLLSIKELTQGISIAQFEKDTANKDTLNKDKVDP